MLAHREAWLAAAAARNDVPALLASTLVVAAMMHESADAGAVAAIFARARAAIE
jgi:hypothetical protein